MWKFIVVLVVLIMIGLVGWNALRLIKKLRTVMWNKFDLGVGVVFNLLAFSALIYMLIQYIQTNF